MKKSVLAFFAVLFSFSALLAQDNAVGDIWQADYRYNDARWRAVWIAPQGATDTYDVAMFRKTLELAAAPESFRVHVSADNRYKLYVNGSFVCDGPCKGDVCNWSYETVDLAPYLKAGRNVVSAVVWNFGPHRPVAIMSWGHTGFLMQSEDGSWKALDTGDGWKALLCDAYSPLKPKVRGYYAAGCTDHVDGASYPWGWQDAGFDDSSWPQAKVLTAAASKGAGDYSWWQLVPRPLPAMERHRIPFGREIAGKTVPRCTTMEFLLDGHVLTTGYPTLTFSGGKGAEISISYAESLYEPGGSKYAKGDRRLVKGKDWVGYSDVIVSDGGENRSFQPLWWRTWRYMKVTVKTADAPLVLNSLTAESSMYPFELASTFDAPGSPELSRMLGIGWRTARLCAHETYMDCPYFEQLQYFGDARIQALVTIFNTRDMALPRRLIDLGRMSMSPDGITMSRYPSFLHQYISPYSLTWIMTCYDWWRYRGDEDFLRTQISAMRTVLDAFGSRVGTDGLVHRMPFWNFADWADLRNGDFPADREGRIAYIDLMYLIALQYAAQMEDAFGNCNIAAGYRSTAETLKKAIRKNYWSTARGLYADNGELEGFSQHANVLAIIAGVADGDEARSLFDKVMSDGSLRQCTIYFRYYLQEAMALTGNSGMLLDNLGVLRDQMALGLTTWAEMPEPSRSDCHAWGSSPNIEFYRMLLGIDSAAPGFAKVRIAPALCGLTEVSGSIPHPAGSVSASYKVQDGTLEATVTLPKGVRGDFLWNGKTTPLHPGMNRIKTE